MAVFRWFLYILLLAVVLALGLLFGASRPELVDQIELPEPVEAVFPINVDQSSSPDTPSEISAPIPGDTITAPAPVAEVGRLDVKAMQGGFIRGRVSPELDVEIAENAPLRSANGGFFYAFDRDRIGTVSVSIPSETLPSDLTLAISARDYDQGGAINTARTVAPGASPPTEEEPAADPAPETATSMPMGFDDMFPEELAVAPRNIAPGTETLEARKRREYRQKTDAIEAAQSTDVTGYLQDWIYPIDGAWRQTSAWGTERTLNGRPQVHAGADLAAVEGTPIIAPADGIVTLAATDFYYEGGVVFLDHGLGLTSMYLHMSEVDVGVGHVVKQGDKIGEVGTTGRSTGPHLCWRVHWNSRNVRVDPFAFVAAE